MRLVEVSEILGQPCPCRRVTGIKTFESFVDAITLDHPAHGCSDIPVEQSLQGPFMDPAKGSYLLNTHDSAIIANVGHKAANGLDVRVKRRKVEHKKS